MASGLTSSASKAGPDLPFLFRKIRGLFRLSLRGIRYVIRRHEYAVAAPFRHCADRFRPVLRRKRCAALDADLESIDLNSIPCKFLVSLEQHHERRNNAQRQFAALGIHAEWKIPVKLEDVPWAQLPRDYERKRAAASQAMTMLSIFDEVERLKAPSFMHFEDDVVFHPRISILLPRLRVPRDWKFIYLGGRNGRIKTPVSSGLVRSMFVSDLHAVIIRAEMIPHMRRVLVDPTINSSFTDFRIARLHNDYPAYLCRPNLAWQSRHSDDSGQVKVYSNYYTNGTVRVGQGD
jgi:hypothetical protein